MRKPFAIYVRGIYPKAIKRQVDYCTRWAEANLGYKVPADHVFTDYDFQGLSDIRPGLKKFMELIGSVTNFTHLIIKDGSRLSRKRSKLNRFINHFNQKKIKIINASSNSELTIK